MLHLIILSFNTVLLHLNCHSSENILCHGFVGFFLHLKNYFLSISFSFYLKMSAVTIFPENYYLSPFFVLFIIKYPLSQSLPVTNQFQQLPPKVPSANSKFQLICPIPYFHFHISNSIFSFPYFQFHLQTASFNSFVQFHIFKPSVLGACHFKVNV